MTSQNKHGLSRNIPEDVARKVRQRCGFGCIVCGAAIYNYEHYDPEFNDAKVHDPNKIQLLCYQHHGEKTAKFMSNETLEYYIANPFCNIQGPGRGPLDLGSEYPRVHFGSTVFILTSTPVIVNGVPIITILPPEPSEPKFRLSASFFDQTGSNTLKIINNEFFAQPGVWDMEVSAGAITIREKAGDIHLRFRIVGAIDFYLERFKSRVGNHSIEILNGVMTVKFGQDVLKFVFANNLNQGPLIVNDNELRF